MLIVFPEDVYKNDHSSTAPKQEAIQMPYIRMGKF